MNLYIFIFRHHFIPQWLCSFNFLSFILKNIVIYVSAVDISGDLMTL